MGIAIILAMHSGILYSADQVVFDFETGDLQGWLVVEGVFDRLVSDRAEFHNTYPDYPDRKYNKQGTYYLSTVEQQPGQPSNDQMTGAVESPVFLLTGPAISMLVGAGTQAGTYVALCTLDGQEVLKARGKAGTEAMQRVTWDAPQLVGKQLYLRVADSETAGWGHVTLDDFRAEGRIDIDATKQRFAGIENIIALRKFKSLQLESLRGAIIDLTETFGEQYPRGREFLDRLDRLEGELEGMPATRQAEAFKEGELLRREALIANPLVSQYPLVYVARIQYPDGGHHAIDTHHHTDENNTGRFKPGGALKVIHFGKGGLTKTLVEPKEGMVREPDIYFSGDKIVFSMRRNIQEDYHIWEIDADPAAVMETGGTGLRQLTGLKEVSDIDPIYLPDNSIVFSSTRERKYNMCSRDVGANLFRMESDGANIYQITKNTLYDNHAALMPDGRILYARWEYVDRNFGDAHGLWTVNPDGTGQAIYWANNTASPGAVFNARVIPDTDRVLCIFGPHHDWLWGSMAIVDRGLGMDVDASSQNPVIQIWPADHRKYIGQGGADMFGMNTRPRYCDPYPLSKKYFLCSKETGQGVQMGIFLVDLFGNELLLHKEGESPTGCYDPMPLKPRERPPVLPARRNFENSTGLVYVQDVYLGTHMKGVARGSVVSLRVVESPPKLSWSWGNWGGQGYQAPGMNWHSFENKRILGSVPVEKDGSAYFEVPSDRFIYFQLLDKNNMMVQSMRSGTVLQSGENLSCIGCHEDRLTPPPLGAPSVAMALKRKPSQMTSWREEPRNFSYVVEVQPVFDKYCVQCHDFGKDAGKKLVLAGDRNPFFNASYIGLWLWDSKLIKCIGGGPADIQQPYSWGSHPSLLSKIIRPMTTEEVAGLNDRERELRGKHRDVQVGAEGVDRINTWLDLNGVYYPEYLTAYPGEMSTSGRSPLDAKQLTNLQKLTGIHFGSLGNNSRKIGAQISFERPELSPCLQKLDRSSEQYTEALAIINAGGEMLKKKPRCDMPGFVPCETDLKRMERYAFQRKVEQQFRTAIREGKKLYDKDVDRIDSQ